MYIVYSHIYLNFFVLYKICHIAIAIFNISHIIGFVRMHGVGIVCTEQGFVKCGHFMD